MIVDGLRCALLLEAQYSQLLTTSTKNVQIVIFYTRCVSVLPFVFISTGLTISKTELSVSFLCIAAVYITAKLGYYNHVLSKVNTHLLH